MKIEGLITEKLIANIQSKISVELDAKNIAEQEKRDADGESSLLKKKNKKIEESIATAQNMQEQALLIMLIQNS